MPPLSTRARATAALVALVAWLALVLQFLVSLYLNPLPGLLLPEAIYNVLSFFTILTNLQVAIVSTAIALNSRGRLANPSLHAATAVYICVVGISYSILLRNVWNPTGTQKVADVLLHDIVPILYPIFWFIFLSPRRPLPSRAVAAWLLWPIIYLIYTLTRGAVTGFYLYPFLDPNASSPLTVAIIVTAITLAFILLSLLATHISRRTP